MEHYPFDNYIMKPSFTELESCNFNEESQLDESDTEKQLNEFEDLLNNIQKFKIVSQNLNRDEILDSAEKLAEHFAKILSED